jgi:hypothetical protein
MIGSLSVFIGLCAGLAPVDMAQVVAERLTALDKLVVDLTVDIYGTHTDTPVLDRAAWEKLIVTLPFHLTILRPNVRAEALKDDPEVGYEPSVGCVYDGTYTQRSVRPSRTTGHVVYHMLPDVQSGVLRNDPILQVFDLGIFDAAPPGRLNIVDVLRHPSATLVRSVGGISTYSASLPMDGYEYTIHFELDINQRGTPLRMKTVLDYDNPDFPPSYYEQFVLRTAEVNGAEFPMETAVTHWGAKVPHYWTVHLFRVNAVEVRDDLSVDDVRIEIDRRNAAVNEYFPDARVRYTAFDQAGQLIEEDEYFKAAGPDTGDIAAILSAHAIPWRMGVPPAAALIGLTTAVTLTYVARRVRR